MRRFSRLAPLWIALLSLLISVVLAVLTPLPRPQFHDEFSYLLAGDTLSRGRLTNPAHPQWEFFESFQILQQPTYASKYPPGQGIALALGKVLAGEPIVGVWISTALACAAVWWALAGFVPRRWATIGAILFATHPLVLKWNWSYWGGAMAVIGGSLVVGGIARFVRARGAAAGFAIGAGAFILLITRPFEGALMIILSALLLRPPSSRPSPGGKEGKALLALGASLVIGVAWIGHFNWRVTGSALRLPYLVYENSYAVNPPFLWMRGTDEDRDFRHDSMRRYYLEWELPQYLEQRHQPIRAKLWDFLRAHFYSIALAVPVLGALLDKLGRRALVVAGVFTLVVFGNLWFFPHYIAPAGAVFLIVVVQGLRRLRTFGGGGRWLLRGAIVLHVVATIVWIARMDRSGTGWHFARADLIEQARHEGRRLLVIVRPGPDHYAHNEWVYNDADIDASPIVWARDMGEARNRELLEYFADREALLMEIGGQTVRFEAYR